MELMQLHFLEWASSEELVQLLQAELEPKKASKARTKLGGMRCSTNRPGAACADSTARVRTPRLSLPVPSRNPIRRATRDRICLAGTVPLFLAFEVLGGLREAAVKDVFKILLCALWCAAISAATFYAVAVRGKWLLQVVNLDIHD